MTADAGTDEGRNLDSLWTMQVAPVTVAAIFFQFLFYCRVGVTAGE